MNTKPSMALILSMLDGDALDHVFAHVGLGYQCHLPVWMTCKAFCERRPHGALETSANAMCVSPSLFKWAMKMGLQSHHLQLNRLTGDGATVLLNSIRPKTGAKSVSYTGKETVEMVRFGLVIEQLRAHRERRIKANAIKTAVALLKQLMKLDPAEFLVDPASIDVCIDFIWQCTTGRPCKVLYSDASLVLSAIMLHLGETNSHVDFGRVLKRILRHPKCFVRYDVLDAANQLDTEGLDYHASAIADFLRIASCNRDIEMAVNFLDQLQPEVLGLYSTQVVELLFRVTEMGVPQALRLLRGLEPSAITAHEELFLRNMRNHHWVVRMTAVSALGEICQLVLIQHIDAVRRLLRDTAYLVRSHALQTMGRLPMADAVSHIHEIASLLVDPHSYVRSAAADVLGMFDSAAVAPYVGSIAKLLDESDSWTRSSAIRTLRKLPVTQTREYTEAIAAAPMCKCKVCSRIRYLEAAQEFRQITGYDD